MDLTKFHNNILHPLGFKEAEKIEALSILSIIFKHKSNFLEEYLELPPSGQEDLLEDTFNDAVSLFSSTRTKEGLKDASIRIFTIGSLLKGKNLDDFIKAYHEVFTADDFNIDDLYDELSRKSKANNEVELTPNHIVDLMVDMADIQDNDNVIDYCLGTSRFLINVHHKNPNSGLIGVEIKADLFLLSCAIMFCNDRTDAIIIHGNLMEDIELQNKLKGNIDKVILNPPYNASQWSCKDFFNQGMELLADKGKFILISPTSTFKNAGEIIEYYDLNCLALMNSDLFKAGTKSAAGTTVNIYNVTKQDYDGDTAYLDWREDGFEVVLKKGRVETGDWSEIKKVWLKDIDTNLIKLEEEDETVYQAFMNVEYNLTEYNFLEI